MHILTAEPLPFDPNQVTPGVIGFTATALVAVVIMLLMYDFNRRVRRINDRADAKARIDAEVAARQQAEAAEAGPSTDSEGTRVDDAPRAAP